MTPGAQALRALGSVALWSGFVLGGARAGLQRAAARLMAERGWRRVEAGEILLRIPPAWGEVEPDPAGGLVIHNRPRRFRTDGDAVWYASAIELRIRPAGSPAPRSVEAMTIYRRIIGEGSAAVLVELAIANGVGPTQRRIARRVLDNACFRHNHQRLKP